MLLIFLLFSQHLAYVRYFWKRAAREGSELAIFVFEHHKLSRLVIADELTLMDFPLIVSITQ